MLPLHKPETFSTKAQWLSWLESLHPSEIDLGLKRICQVFLRLKLPRPKKIFTVAGTNGKGSTIALLEVLAENQGLSVGRYTSPHLIEFNERISLNGDSVSDNDLIWGFEQINIAREEISLTYFEYTTLVAFLLFAQKNMDIWLIEVGLGGRLDAANCLDTDVAVVTSIALDHKDWLGDDLEQIRYEKACVARSGRPLIFGEGCHSILLDEKLTQYYSSGLPSILAAQSEFKWEIKDDHWGFQQGDNSLSALPVPDLPVNNAACAFSAWLSAGFSLTSQQARSALNSWHVPGRLQRITYQGTQLIVDVGHNPHAAEYICQHLKQVDVVLVGMMADKDTQSVLSILQSLSQYFICVDLPVKRAIAKEQLALQLSDCNVTLAADVSQALDLLSPGQTVLVCGSFITCGLVLKQVQG